MLSIPVLPITGGQKSYEYRATSVSKEWQLALKPSESVTSLSFNLDDYFPLKRNAIGIFALLRVVSCRDKTQCVGKVNNISSTQRVASFDFLKENLDGGC